MSISIATNGILVPKSTVIREQFSSIEVVLDDPQTLEGTLEDVQEIQLSMVESYTGG